MSGRVGDLSQKQQDSLNQFRDNVKDILKPEHDDAYLLRWLRARNFDLKKSETMIRNDYTWRKQIGADTIQETFEVPEVLKKFYIGGACGFDNEGCPIWYEPSGYLDIRGIIRSAKKSDIMKMKVQQVEKIVYHMKHEKRCRQASEISLLVDMELFGIRNLWKPGIDMQIELVSMFEDHYPETLKTAFVVNAPRIFPIVYNLFKPFLSEATLQKIKILGSNYKEVLPQYIPPEDLPARYGGTMVDPDGNERCETMINYGGDVPESYYGQQQANLECFTESSISKGSTLQLDYEINVRNSVIRWQFKTDGFDIGFGVYRRTKDRRQKAGDMEPVMPSGRVNSHLVPEDGSVKCDETGTYVVRFDNTYSWTRSKKLFYQIEILEPDSHMSIPRSPSQGSNNVESVSS